MGGSYRHRPNKAMAEPFLTIGIDRGQLSKVRFPIPDLPIELSDQVGVANTDQGIDGLIKLEFTIYKTGFNIWTMDTLTMNL